MDIVIYVATAAVVILLHTPIIISIIWSQILSLYYQHCNAYVCGYTAFMNSNFCVWHIA